MQREEDWVCRKCGVTFTPSPSRRAAHDYRCNPCRRAYQKQWLLGDRAKAARNKRHKSYRHRPLLRARFLARDAVRHALRNGRLVKLPCEQCGDTRAHAHHDDYMKPLEVRWLCRKHHEEHHAYQKANPTTIQVDPLSFTLGMSAIRTGLDLIQRGKTQDACCLIGHGLDYLKSLAAQEKRT